MSVVTGALYATDEALYVTAHEYIQTETNHVCQEAAFVVKD